MMRAFCQMKAGRIAVPRRTRNDRRRYRFAAGLLVILFLTGCGSLAGPTGEAVASPTPAENQVAVGSTEAPAPLPETGTSPQPALEATVPSTQVPSTAVQASETQAPAVGPTCTSPADLTPAMTEGPYYKAGSPERASLLEPGIPGERLVITGYVLTPDCQPIANALLDFWQADGQGVYDNAGYRLRGHLFTDQAGRYQIETVVPGEYPGRTEHIHVKIQPPGGDILTTQLFFPGVQRNETDRIFSPELLVEVEGTGNGIQALFNFVVNAQ